MRWMRTVVVSGAVLSCLVAAGPVTPVFTNHQEAAVIERALSGTLSDLAKGGAVLDQEANRLRGGDNEWSRMSPPAHFQETPPMCNTGVWMEWEDANFGIEEYIGATVEVCYMLAKDEGAGTIEPCADGRSSS